MPSKRRICEDRIVTFTARGNQGAVGAAHKIGRDAEFEYENEEGNTVLFEFVGVVDMVSLDLVSEANEVWWDVYERLLPMERKKQLVRTHQQLLDRL